MYVTRHSHVLDPRLLERLWRLYDRAYRSTSKNSVSHEMVFRSEFDTFMADGTNRIWVAWEDDRPVALTLIATDIASTRYLSERYFEKHFPERYKSGRVHYVLWVVVDPDFVAGPAILRLAKEALGREAADGALLVFDVPDSNERQRVDGGAAELMIRLARAVGEADLVALQVQRYYAVDFDPSGAIAPTRERDDDARPPGDDLATVSTDIH